MKIYQIKRISINDAKKLIYSIARNNIKIPSNISDNRIEDILRDTGVSFETLKQRAREGFTIPLIEDIPFKATVETFTTGDDQSFTSSIIENDTGFQLTSSEGNSALVSSVYVNTFQNIKRAVNITIDDCLNYPDHRCSIFSGSIACLDAYLTSKVNRWNRLNPNHQLIDNKQNKVSFAEKLEKWIPIMTNKSFDKFSRGEKIVGHFNMIKKIRDNECEHMKHESLSFNTKKIVLELNLLKYGFCDFLIYLHELYEDKIPHEIIRFYYFCEFSVDENF